MVKKSFLSRLFGRDDGDGASATDRAARPDRADRADRTDRRVQNAAEVRRARLGEDAAPRSDVPRAGLAPASDVQETAPEDGDESAEERVQPARGPAVPAREMSREEEVSLRLHEGFQGINQVLSGIDRKIDQQQKSSEELMVSVRKIPEMMKDVPDASRAGLELLATISTILDRQGKVAGELLEKVGQMPRALDQLEERLRAQNAAAERGAQKAEEAASALAAVRGRVEELGTAQARKQDELLEELRRQQQESDRRVGELIARSQSTTKVMIFLVVLAIAAFLLVVNALSGH